MGNFLLREDENGLAILTFNRPDKLNSLNVALFQELEDQLEQLERQTEMIGCVMVRGAGRCFSSGHDLSDIAAGEKPPRPGFQGRIIERLANLPQATIMAVHGYCYTGALELALAGDIILASANAKFADTHAKWALAPVWGMSQRLPRRIGRAKAHEMMLTCRTVGGAEATAMGLANHCFADENFFEAAEAYVRDTLAHSWFSHRANKKLMLETDGMSLTAGLSYEVHHFAGLGPDMQARIAKFTSKS